MSGVNVHGIHGIVASLSLVQKGWKSIYFDGTESDRASKIRLIEFNTRRQKLMQDFMSKQQPIKLSDCKIMQGSKTRQQIEVLLKASMPIGESPKKARCRVLNSKTTHHHRSCCTSSSWSTLTNKCLLRWKWTRSLKHKESAQEGTGTVSTGMKGKMLSKPMMVHLQK